MKTITVTIENKTMLREYVPRYISFGDNCVYGCDTSRNMGFLLGYCSKEEAEKRKKPIQDEMDKYNRTVKALWNISGFSSFFAQKGYYVTIKEIKEKLGEKAAALAESLRCPTNCYPDLQIRNGVFKLRNTHFTAFFSIDNDKYDFDAERHNVDCFSRNDKLCFLDWSNDGLHLRYAIFMEMIRQGMLKEEIVNFVEEETVYLFNDRCSTAERFLAMDYIIQLLISCGYMKQYALIAENYKDLWENNTEKEDGTVLFSLLDPNWKKDKSLSESVSCYMNSIFSGNDEEGYTDEGFCLEHING